MVSNSTGARLETYTIAGPKGSGAICMNGAAAHLIHAGHQVIIMGFELSDMSLEPKVVLVDLANKFERYLPEMAGATAQ